MKPIGVTIISSSYKKVGEEAVRRFKKHTGLLVKIVRCYDLDGFQQKLELDRIVGRRPAVFFDADLWFVRPVALGGHGFHAAHDPAVFDARSWPAKDCVEFGMDPLQYFNTGLMVLDFRLQEHRALFQNARKLAGKQSLIKRMADKTDQGWINMAAQQMGLQWGRLPASFNFYMAAAIWGCVLSIPRVIYGIHAAGVPAKHKHGVLRAQAATFGQHVEPMQDAALRFHHAYQEEFR